MGDELLKDFDVLSPPKRTAKIGGEVIDVSIIPARVALQFISFSKKHDVKTFDNEAAESFDDTMLEDMMGIVATLCQRSNPVITKDWLLDNVDINVLMQFVQYVFSSINKSSVASESGTGDGGKSKN